MLFGKRLKEKTWWELGRTVIEGKSGQIKFEMPKSIEISISKKVLGQIPCTHARVYQIGNLSHLSTIVKIS